MATIGDESAAYPSAFRNKTVSIGKATIIDTAGFELDASVTTASPGGTGVATLTIGNPVSLVESKLKPTAAALETYSRTGDAANVAALTSGTLLLVGMALPKGQVVTNITFFSGTQAAVTPTNQWFVLCDASRNVLAVTADDLTTAWGASAAKTLAVGAAYTVPTTGFYYLGVMVAAGTAPSLLCRAYTVTTLANLAPILQGASGTGLTTPPALAATMTAITVGANRPYAYVS